MTQQEDKDLLLKYLCMALPYGVVIKITSDDGMLDVSYNIKLDADLLSDLLHGEDDFMPYLRPMSSMTEEEKVELISIRDTVLDIGNREIIILSYEQIIWFLQNHFDFLQNHFDFLGLIPKGLAIEVSKENNPYNTEI